MGCVLLLNAGGVCSAAQCGPGRLLLLAVWALGARLVLGEG